MRLPFLAAAALPILVSLPLLMLLLFVPGFPVEEALFLRVLFTELAPIGPTTWYILARRLVTHQRSGYGTPSTLFVGTARAVMAMLALGIHRLL